MVRPASDPTCVGNQQDRHFAGWWDDVISFFTQYTFFFFLNYEITMCVALCQAYQGAKTLIFRNWVLSF